MKKINYILGCTLFSAAVLTTSCVDDSLFDFPVDKPAVLEQLEYLNDYDFLKSYVNRETDPNFKLGGAIEAEDYIKKGLVYRLANANFDEITAGNAMKYASVVGNDGSMNFSTVSAFVKAAKEAGTTVYGHTLAWHSQQNTKYLNSLLANKKIDIDPTKKVEIVDYEVDYSKSPYTFWKGIPADASIGINSSLGCLEVVNPVVRDQNYNVQYHTADNITTKKGQSYSLKIMVKGSAAGTLTLGLGSWSERASLPSVNFTTDWKEFELPFTAVVDGGHLMTQSGLFAGTIQIKYVKVVHYEAPKTEVEVEVERRCIQVKSSDMVDAAWDTQFWIMTDQVFKKGDTWTVSMNVRADKAATIGTQIHTNVAGGYKHWAAIGSVPFARKWTLFEATGKFDASMAGGSSIAFNMNDFKEANAYYFDDISFKVNGVELIKNSSCDDDNMKVNYIAKESRGTTGPARFVDRLVEVQELNSIPLTKEEKRDTLVWAMNNWVKGMMQACGGYVTSWDVVNEALSGVDKNSDGFYDLQSVKNVSADDAKNNFYWQDNMGDTLYVRTAVAAARKYFKEFEGDPAKLKLFINDYNLESDWDDNKKLKSLIHWIGTWESDKVTKIDGIGTQMHISYFADPATQKSKEEHIVEMFKLMAASGKLVKITELDMGYVDGSGKSVKTANLTDEQHRAMAGFYTFIIKKYFEIIPAAQRYGITQWCMTDSPESSSWRGGEPTGLWDANYYRKHTYAGFANGLSNK